MRLVLLGPPGAGKGTQAELLAKKYRVPQISTGDIFRRARSQGTELGKEAEKYISEGNLVPDNIVIKMVEERLKESDCQGGFILDGFPRTILQAEALDDILSFMELSLDKVLEISSSRRVIIDRLSARRICRECGATYHLQNKPPKSEGVCDICGGLLYQRDDDKKETIGKRLNIYESEIEALRDYYTHRGLLALFDGDRDIMIIYKEICSLLEDEGQEDNL